MAKVGYARVSSIGQSLEIQLDRLAAAGCEKIFSEKQSGTTVARPQFKACMEYLREGDILVVTRLDRLARSVLHLAKISDRFDEEKISLCVIDQNIDTSTPSGKLLFNMLGAIAEFENALRAERQREGIERAKLNKVKFGRPTIIDNVKASKIIEMREAGVTIGKIVRELVVSQASVYRILKSKKKSEIDSV